MEFGSIRLLGGGAVGSSQGEFQLGEGVREQEGKARQGKASKVRKEWQVRWMLVGMKLRW